MKKATGKATAKAAGNPKAKVALPQPQSIKIAIDVTEETPTYYTNHFEVGHSNFEFMLNVSRFPPKPSGEQLRRVAEQGVMVLNPGGCQKLCV